MATVQSIKFEIANFSIFCVRIIVIFWTTSIAREVFSVAMMGNVTRILPVLQWLEVVIAFVSSLGLWLRDTTTESYSVMFYMHIA